MPNPYFSFKQFTVYHDRCAMKVGIDGVLLGAWANIENSKRILDIGTGTGLISLMLAQRSNALIDAIDIDSDAISQANENINKSPWSNRIQVYESSLQEFAKTCNPHYDLIVSNPPYFINSTKTPTENRTLARHTDTLTHEELIENSRLLISPEGRICIILPVSEGLQCVEYAEKAGLYCHKLIWVYPKPNSNPKRLLLEFALKNGTKTVSDIEIETQNRHQYSVAFTQLAKDFYLKL